MNMKNIIKTITLTLVILAAGTYCRKKLLDKVPNDRLSSEIFWKTENDAKLAWGIHVKNDTDPGELGDIEG